MRKHEQKEREREELKKIEMSSTSKYDIVYIYTHYYNNIIIYVLIFTIYLICM